MTIAVAGNREPRKVDLRELGERQTREALAAALEAAVPEGAEAAVAEPAVTGAVGSETAAPEATVAAAAQRRQRRRAFIRQEDRELEARKHQTPVRPAHP